MRVLKNCLLDNLLVVGVGLMGGSILKAVREAGIAGRRLGLDRDPEAVRKSLAMGLIAEEIHPDMTLTGKTLVILAVHLDAYRDVLEELLLLLPPETVITDVGSVKAPVVRDLTPLCVDRNMFFVGGHPIAGTEKSGVENSLKGLFLGARVILTPENGTDEGALELVRTFWEALGTRVEEMDPDRHDTVFAAVSHLPHAVTYALVKTMGDAEKELGDLLRYSGGGFKDFTRIAASNPWMWREIFGLNRDQVLAFLRRFHSTLEEMERFLEAGDWDALEAIMEEARWLRRGLD
jgi:prephenate dehydrogenase